MRRILAVFVMVFVALLAGCNFTPEPTKAAADASGAVFADASAGNGQLPDGAVAESDFGMARLEDAGSVPDAAALDAGPTDAGPTDAGPTDAGPTDVGPTDAGPTDAGPTDAVRDSRITNGLD